MKPPAPGKIERIDLRTTPSIKRTLKWAAEVSHCTITAFLLQNGVVAPPDTAFSAGLPERKVERIVLRLSPSTKNQLKELAEAAGMTMSECLIDSGLKAAAHLQTQIAGSSGWPPRDGTRGCGPSPVGVASLDGASFHRDC